MIMVEAGVVLVEMAVKDRTMFDNVIGIADER